MVIYMVILNQYTNATEKPLVKRLEAISLVDNELGIEYTIQVPCSGARVYPVEIT